VSARLRSDGPARARGRNAPARGDI